MTQQPGTRARRYAEAAFEVARDKHDVQAWRDELGVLAGILANEEAAGVFDNPRLNRGQRVALAISLAGDRIKAERLNFFKLLVLHGRSELIGAIREKFEALVAEAEGRLELEVISARELDEGERDRLQQMLSQRIGRVASLRVRVDPSILGGAIVRQGDRVNDGSLRRRLQELRIQLSA